MVVEQGFISCVPFVDACPTDASGVGGVGGAPIIVTSVSLEGSSAHWVFSGAINAAAWNQSTGLSGLLINGVGPVSFIEQPAVDEIVLEYAAPAIGQTWSTTSAATGIPFVSGRKILAGQSGLVT